MERTPKNIHIGSEARNLLLEGALLLARAVQTTYGPHGGIALVDRFAGLLPTKDGVSVAREITLAGKPQALGAQILKEACLKVNERVGDGTTTAAILSAALLQDGHRLVSAGYHPREIVKGMEEARDEALKVLRDCSRPASSQTDIEHVARVASNGDMDIAPLLAKAVMAVGKDGTVSVQDGHRQESTLEFKSGLECEALLASRYFITDTDTLTAELEGALVAVINQPLNSFKDVVPLLEEATQWPHNSLVIFAPSFGGEVISGIVFNVKGKITTAIPALAPGVHIQKAEYLKDIAALAGAVFVDPVAGYDICKWKAEWLGSLRKVSIGTKKSLLEAYEEPDKQAALQARIQELRVQEKATTSEYDLDLIRERKAKLSGGFTILKVGGVTELALKERRARVEDAFGAVRAALREGLLPGGGTAYLWAAQSIERPVMSPGYAALRKALRAPMEALGGTDAPPLVTKEWGDNPWVGWDASDKTVRDLQASPLIADPTAVLVAALETAVSVVSTLLTVECSISIRR